MPELQRCRLFIRGPQIYWRFCGPHRLTFAGFDFSLRSQASAPYFRTTRWVAHPSGFRKGGIFSAFSSFQFLFSSYAREKKRRRRNSESLAQLLDVALIQAALLVQDFGNDAFRTKDGRQIFLPEIVGFHQRAKNFQRRGIRNRMMLFFVSFNQSQQDPRYFSSSLVGFSLLASLSRTDRYSSC